MRRQSNPAPSQRDTSRPRILSYGLAAVTLSLMIGTLLVRSMHTPMSVRITDLFERDGGHHPGFRRNHAKGVCVTGHFESNGRGAALSRATVFAQGTVPVTGRFSAPGGSPAQADGDATVRSFALLFAPRGGEQWRAAMNSAPVFMVATPQAIIDELDASRPDPRTGRTDPVRIAAFLQRHPETQPLRDWEQTHPPSSGFDNAAYYSINAFRFTDAQGRTHDVRWRVEPQQPYQAMREAQAGDPDFLAHDLDDNLSHSPARWHLILTEARPGDPINDATRAWPDDGRHLEIDAGTLVIDHAQSQIDGPCRDINFDPLVLPAGIAASDDPLLAARSTVYAESFRRRITEEAQAQQGRAHSAALEDGIASMKSWIDPDQSHGVRHDD